MATELKSLLEQTWYMAADTVSVSVADSDGTNTRSISATGAWYRTRLVASGATSGTIDSPHSLCAKFQAALNTSHSYYSVRYQSDGTIGITYTGGGTSTITWGTNGAKLRRMLGFGESATTSIANNATAVGTYHPCGSVLSGVMTGGTGYQTEPAGVAAAIANDGRVYAVSSQANVTKMRRSLLYHPTTYGARTALSEYSTPIFGGSSTNVPSIATMASFVQPWTSAASSGGGGAAWSVLAFMSTALYGVAICPHAFSTIRTSTSDDVLVGWIVPESLQAMRAQALSIPNYVKRTSWNDLELSLTSTITVATP